jgi:predicted MFS family arabinose efflux permease
MARLALYAFSHRRRLTAPEPALTPSQIEKPNPARLILMLALAPTIGLGIGRFAYSLVLPDMRDTLGWSYSAAGFMNTVNAAGYLAGALIAAPLSRRLGLLMLVRGGSLACILSLALCAVSANFALLSFARGLAGIGAALSFVAGGALAATIAQTEPARSSLLLGLFYTGPGLGILLSGLLSPFLLQAFGPGSWWIVWLAMTLLSLLLYVPLRFTREPREAPLSEVRDGGFALRPVWRYLAGYLMFGVGYIAYMTFMIAFVRDAGGGAIAQSAFWSLIGLSAFASPWVWRGALARTRGGGATAFILLFNVIGAGLPLLGQSIAVLAISAIVFGVAFFAVVASTTAFVRVNYPQRAWAGGIGVMTVAFGIGQTFGPIGIGAISDATGTLSSALLASAIVLALGAVLCWLQKPVSAAPPR